MGSRKEDELDDAGKSLTIQGVDDDMRAGRGGQDAHLLSLTEPSFLPTGSSNSTPHHSPGANSVAPRYLSTPVLLPWLDETITRSPIFKSLLCDTVDDRLVVDASAFTFISADSTISV